MFENLITDIKNGFITANATRKLVFGDRQLFIYPVLAIVVSILLILAMGAIIFGAAFFAYGVASGKGISTSTSYNYSYNSTTSASNGPSNGILLLFILSIFIIYILVFFVVIYFTTAMLIAFREYANGNRISLGEALKRTAPYAMLLLQWAVFISTIKALLEIINIIISSVLGRYGFVGNMVARVLYGVENLALAIIGLFALPVILDEKTGAIATMKTSARFIIKNFGETFGGFVYSEIVQFILIAIGEIFLIIALLLVFASMHSGLATAALELGVLLIVCFVAMLLFATPVGSLIVFLAFLLASALHAPGFGVLPLIFVSIGLVIVMVAHLVKYVLFNCFKLIVYDYKTRKILPKGFDAKLIEDSIKNKGGAKPGSPINPNPSDLNLFGSGNNQGNI